MDAIVIVGLMVLAWSVYGAIYVGARIPGILLRRRFKKLPAVVGESAAVIVSVVGEPHHTSTAYDGRIIYQWNTPGYQIALRFENDRCKEVSYILD